MAQRRHLALFAALLVVGMTNPLHAQDIKSGVCPTGNSDRYSSLSSGGSFGEIDNFGGTFGSQARFAAPQYSPMLLNANAFGAGAVGTFPISGNYILRTSIIGLSSSPDFGLAQQNSVGFLLPIEFGLRIPIVHSVLSTMDYTLYGETSAGLLLGMSFPVNGNLLGYSIPNSRFANGASAYLGLGNTLRFDRYVGIYLNGGAGYFDLFSSTFMPRTNYLYPSISVGFLFNMMP
jgi:hypothetical protein